MWHGVDLAHVPRDMVLGLAYVPCGMFYVMFQCHVGWFRPSICATWHGLGLIYVACPMPCLDATWHGLDLAYVPCGMS